MTPPDTTGAIGPNQYVEFVNEQIRAYARATLAASGEAVNLSEFTGGTAVCDPQIKYDPQSERWFYAAIRCDGTTTANTMYMGFSKTSDPTDFSTTTGHGWCGYEYKTGTSLEDYPKLGLDSQHIIIGTNSFNAETEPEEFVTAHIFAGPKPTGPIEATCPAAPPLTQFGEPLKTSVGNPAFTPEPATVADGSPSGYVVSSDVDGEHVMMWQVTGTASEPKLIARGAPKVPRFEIAPPVPQPGSTDELDSLDPRFTQAVAASDPNAGGAEAVWTQQTIFGGGGSVVRWYELVPSKAEVRQLGTISDPSRFVFNGAIAPTLTGGAVITYDTASSSDRVRIMAQSRVGSAPLGTMNSPIELGASAAVDSDYSCPSQPLGKQVFTSTTCRWGDYAGASVDPTDGNVVWGSNQLNGPTGANFETEVGENHGAQWATRNFALEANDVAPTASFTISPDPATVGALVAFNGAASSDADGTIASFAWSFGDGSEGSGATPSHAYGKTGTYEVTLKVTDNGGQTATATHSVTVNTASVQGGVAAPPAAAAAVPGGGGLIASLTPNSSFVSLGVTVNQKSMAITFAESVEDPGTFTWLLTFQNGKFGVFAAKHTRCKRGFVKLAGRCRPARIVFSKGTKSVASPGSVTFTVHPSVSAMKALKNAVKQRKGLVVTATVTYQSSRGGQPVSRVQSLIVKRRR